jgi:hypothetical protein
VELQERAPYLKRLAFYTITEERAAKSEYFHLTGSKPETLTSWCPWTRSTLRRCAGCWLLCDLRGDDRGVGDQAQYPARGGV